MASGCLGLWNLACYFYIFYGSRFWFGACGVFVSGFGLWGDCCPGLVQIECLIAPTLDLDPLKSLDIACCGSSQFSMRTSLTALSACMPLAAHATAPEKCRWCCCLGASRQDCSSASSTARCEPITRCLCDAVSAHCRIYRQVLRQCEIMKSRIMTKTLNPKS